MSSLEERREARRRRRQQEEESPQVNHASNNNNNNNTEEEDDGEKRRRERREARLKMDQERGGGDSSATEERSSRRSRRRGGDDEEEEATSASEPAADPEPESEPEQPAAAPPADEVDNSGADAEAEEQRKREEEEAAAEAERQKQAEEERRKRQEEERRQHEEKRRQRTPRTPRHERQSRSKNRTPRGPLKTPRSARQQSVQMGTPSEQTILEEDKKAQINLNPSLQVADTKENVLKQRKHENRISCDITETRKIITTESNESSETKSNLSKRTTSSHGSATDLYAKIDVKAKVKALEAERNKNMFPFSSKGVYEENEAKQYSQSEVHSTSSKRVSEEMEARPSDPSPSAKRIRSIQSSSDTDFDDRLTDIVATNREVLAHDDTIERFTDFELGSCSSYDDIFPPKDQTSDEKVPKLELMSTNEFTPDLINNEVFQSSDSLIETQTLTVKKQDTPNTDSSSEQQPLKSILKVKTQEDQHHRESSINRHKTRSSAKERDLKRSSSRSRTRAPPRTPSDTSSDENEHFIPFSVDNEEVIYNPEKRRASALEIKAEKVMSNNEAKNRSCLSPKPVPGIESMSENESMFSGDDVSSTRNSISVGTSVETLDSDYGELMSANTTLTANPDDEYGDYLGNTPSYFATHGNINTITVNDMTDNFVSTAVLMSPGQKHKSGVDKVKDTEQRDSDNSLESLESSLESSGFAGVKSDIPFNAKKKKIHARRSGRISQMTSIWSKMPDSKEDVYKEAKKSSSVDPPRNIFVIKSSTDDQESEESNQDSSVARHKTIDSRMTELQHQLHRDEAKKLETTQNIPSIRINEKETKISKRSKVSHEDPHRYTEAKKRQLDELFGKLNSKLKSKDHNYDKQQYSERQAPIFLAPFDSSVDAMQRSQSQPILNTNEEMEYYDPSQSVREYIQDESPSKTPEPQSFECRMDEGEEVGSNKAECSSGNESSRLGGSSVSNNWSAGSNAGSGSNPEDYSDSDCEEDEYYIGDEEQREEDQTPRESIQKGGKVFTRKESAFSLKSNISDGPFQNSGAGFIIGDIPDDEDVFERQAHTQEWLQEDVGYSQVSRHRSSNASTLSNADSTSAASVGSLDGASDGNGDLYYPDDQEYGMYTDERMSPGDVDGVPVVGLGMQCGQDEGGSGEDCDLKLPLHFLNDSTPDDEEDYTHQSDIGVGGDGEFDSDRCMDGSASDQENYGYSSDDLEEGGLDSSCVVEYGDDYFQGEVVDGVMVGGECGGREYLEVGEEVDVIHSMDAMGEDILNYLSDEMEVEGEVEEWGEEEESEEMGDVGGERIGHSNQEHYGDCEIVGGDEARYVGDQFVHGDDSVMEEGIVYYTPNSGGGVVGDQQLAYPADHTQLDLRQMIHEGNEMIEESHFHDDDEDDDDDYNDGRIGDDVDDGVGGRMNSAGITESARRREMFKEHHGHIDDKDILHSENLPRGQELPDNDEFFISFEYDEDHGQGLNEGYGEDSEHVHDVEVATLDHNYLHSAQFEECEEQTVQVVPLSPNALHTAQYVESKNTVLMSLSSENLSCTQFVEPYNVKMSSQNSLEALHAHQLTESEVLHTGVFGNDESEILHTCALGNDESEILHTEALENDETEILHNNEMGNGESEKLHTYALGDGESETLRSNTLGNINSEMIHLDVLENDESENLYSDSVGNDVYNMENSHQVVYTSHSIHELDSEDGHFVHRGSDSESVHSTKSNRSDYEDRDIPPELREIRKQLMCELKDFNPKKLRKTSASTDDDEEDDKVDAIPKEPIPTIEFSLGQAQRNISPVELLETKQISNLSPIEKYIQTKQESSNQIQMTMGQAPSITQIQVESSTNDSNQTVEVRAIEDALKSNNSTESDNRTEFVRLRRNSSSGGDEGGVFSKERRRSIRSFWFQLDEDEKKQKENDDNWRRKRDENQHRSRERHIVKRMDDANGENETNASVNIESAQHQNDNAQSRVSSTHGYSAPFSGSMQHLDLASNFGERTGGTEACQSYEKPRKKPPPAVAPKPRRKTTIGISFNADSEKDPSNVASLPPAAPKPPKPIQGRTTSVKEIASFHEKQTEALHETKTPSKPVKLNIFSPSPVPNASNKADTKGPKDKIETVSFKDRLKEVLPKSINLDRAGKQIYPPSQLPANSAGSNRQGISESPSSGNGETILSARSEEQRKAKLKEVERILIKRLAENGNMKEAPKSTPPVAAKPILEQGMREGLVKSITMNASQWSHLNQDDSSVVNLPKSHSIPVLQHEELSAQSTEIKIESVQSTSISQAKTILNFNSVISPFSLNLPLNPPTLEEIDVASPANDDLREPLETNSKESTVKQQLWLNPNENKESNPDKPQAPRPRFNAKALAPAQNVLPAWAKKIEVKPVTGTPYLPPLSHSLSGSGSTTSLDNVGNTSVMSGELSSRDKEIKSWATDYIRDVISLDHRQPRNASELDSFGNKIASDSDSVNTSFSANSSFYGHLPLHMPKHGDVSFLSEGQSEPLSSRSLKSKEPTLSVAERISKMQEKMEASKEAAKTPEKLNPTQSQKQFASLLQNRLIDVIAQEADDDKKERERERKKKRPKHPPPNSWAAERLRLFGSGKSVIKEDSTWSPDQTSTPSTLSREPTKFKIDVESLSTATKSSDRTVDDATSKLEDLSQSLSQNEVIKMNKVHRREGRSYRRVTTGGINISEMREKFAAGTDSSGGSSTESSFGTPKEKTRPNSPWISSSGAFPPSPLVSSVINKLTSAENTDTEGKSPVRSREPSLSRSRGRVAERVRHFSSRENSLPNSRSSSRSRRESEVISGTFDLKMVSELVRRVESSEESGTSLASSLSFQPGELASRYNESKLVSDTLKKLQADQFSSSNSSPSNSLDRRTSIRTPVVKNVFLEKEDGTRYQQNENAVAKPFKRLDEGCLHEGDHQLSQAVSALADFQTDKTVRNKRMDKDRRHTTQINFAELRERYNTMGHAKVTPPPQSPAMHAIYASSVRHVDTDSDNPADDNSSPKQMQVARSSTFQKTKPDYTKEQLGGVQDPNPSVYHPQEKGRPGNNAISHPNPIERPKDLGFAFSLNQQVTSTPCSSIVSPGSKPVSARHHDVEDDVFSPLSSARVPESLNLPSDLPPPPAFLTTGYEDDISHGELAESESSDTVEFVKRRYEVRAAERQQQQQYHDQHHHLQRDQQHPHNPHQQHSSHASLPTNQYVQHQHYQQHHHSHQHHHHQQQQQHQVQTTYSIQTHGHSHFPPSPHVSSSPPANLLEAAASASTTPSASRHHTTFPETIIDTRTATGHVRCRILSEIPAEPDESGIGASDQSMGSNSTLSVSSIVQDRAPETRPLTLQLSSNSTSSLHTTEHSHAPATKSTVSHFNLPDIRLPDNDTYPSQSPDHLQSPIRRKFSLGNESVSSIEGAACSQIDDAQLSPRRASVHAIEQHNINTHAFPDSHSSNTSLSQDSYRSKHEHTTHILSHNNDDDESRHSTHRHESKRRKSKSKFMQDVMDKRRNKSEPNEGKSSHSKKKHLYSSSDIPSNSQHTDERRGSNSNGLFGTTVGGRKKSTGSPNGNDSANTMKGYSKRFDALWARFDPDLKQKTVPGPSGLSGQSTSMPHDEAEAAEKARQEEDERERERMEAEEAARVKAEEEQKKKKKGKRKGLGGLSAEKKKLLKKLIMQRAAEELRNEAKQKAAEKEKYINDRVAPLKTDGLGQSELQALVKDLHARVSTLEEDVYDWEIKIRKQDFEINELTLKVNDTKGKFIKPVLRKVNKTESKLKKIQILKESTDFRGTLKSTGQNKYALEEDEGANNTHWRET